MMSFKQYAKLGTLDDQSPEMPTVQNSDEKKKKPRWNKERAKELGSMPSLKSRARMKAREILEMHDFSPFEEMINLYRSTHKERIKVDILTELCSYIAPKLKSIELSGENDKAFVINFNLTPGQKRDAVPVAATPVTVIEHDNGNEEDEGT